MVRLDINGILPPLTTPFDSRGELDLDGLRKNVEALNETRLAGYVALGSNGEAVHISSDERPRVIETVKKTAARNKRLIVGINEFSTAAAVRSAKVAADCGAEAILVVTPFFYKSLMTQEALLRYFSQVAEASPVPLFIYNIPQNTGVTIDPDTVAMLAAHENIAGIKDSSGNMSALAETIRKVPSEFKVFVGNGSIAYPSLMMGAAGAILAVACVAPEPCVDLFEAAMAGDHPRARELQNRIARISQFVTAGLGVEGLKAALDLAGYTGGAPRPPLTPPRGEQLERLRSAMRESGLFSRLE